jgi:hypothetical protein
MRQTARTQAESKWMIVFFIQQDFTCFQQDPALFFLFALRILTQRAGRPLRRAPLAGTNAIIG